MTRSALFSCRDVQPLPERRSFSATGARIGYDYTSARPACSIGAGSSFNTRSSWSSLTGNRSVAPTKSAVSRRCRIHRRRSIELPPSRCHRPHPDDDALTSGSSFSSALSSSVARNKSAYSFLSWSSPTQSPVYPALVEQRATTDDVLALTDEAGR